MCIASSWKFQRVFTAKQNSALRFFPSIHPYLLLPLSVCRESTFSFVSPVSPNILRSSSDFSSSRRHASYINGETAKGAFIFCRVTSETGCFRLFLLKEKERKRRTRRAWLLEKFCRVFAGKVDFPPSLLRRFFRIVFAVKEATHRPGNWALALWDSSILFREIERCFFFFSSLYLSVFLSLLSLPIEICPRCLKLFAFLDMLLCVCVCVFYSGLRQNILLQVVLVGVVSRSVDFRVCGGICKCKLTHAECVTQYFCARILLSFFSLNYTPEKTRSSWRSEHRDRGTKVYFTRRLFFVVKGFG